MCLTYVLNIWQACVLLNTYLTYRYVDHMFNTIKYYLILYNIKTGSFALQEGLSQFGLSPTNIAFIISEMI